MLARDASMGAFSPNRVTARLGQREADKAENGLFGFSSGQVADATTGHVDVLATLYAAVVDMTDEKARRLNKAIELLQEDGLDLLVSWNADFQEFDGAYSQRQTLNQAAEKLALIDCDEQRADEMADALGLLE
jgi:hypothetical protein